MNKKTISYCLVMVILMFYWSCTKHTENQKQPINAPKPAPKLITSDSEPPQTSQTTQPSYQSETAISGHLAVEPKQKILVSAPIPGFVQAILITVGEKVKKGQILAYISHPELIKLQEKAIATEYEIILKQKQIDRSELLKGDLISEAKTEQLNTELRLLKNTKNSLLAQLALGGVDTQKLLKNKQIQIKIPISAPQNAGVAEVSVNQGSYVENSQPLASLVDKSSVHIEFDVYAHQAIKLNLTDTIWFNTPNSMQTYPSIVKRINPVGQPETQLIEVHAKVLNQSLNHWPIGTYVTGYLQNKPSDH